MAYTPSYDSSNIFARILRGEIPCRKAGENAHTLAFYDIQPQAPVHVLLVPKGPYVDAAHFAQEATKEEQASFWSLLAELVQQTGVSPKGIEGGFRLIANGGFHGGQEVPHFHMHLLGGRPLGPMLSPAEG